MKKSKFVKHLLIAGVAFSGGVARADTFNNESVVTLSKAGVGDDVLLAKIGSLPCGYDISTNQIVALKTGGVSNAVIAAMVARCSGSDRAQGVESANANPLTKRTSGLYIELGKVDHHNISAIHPTTASGGRITGNGSILFPFKVKLEIPRASAQTHASSATPVFYFYFETDDKKVGDFGTSATVSAQSPSEFSLVRFKLKNGQREMEVGKANMFGTSLGINSKDAIQFAVNDKGDGVYSVQPNSPLAPGEYGFVLRAGSNSYRIYDFDVTS